MARELYWIDEATVDFHGEREGGVLVLNFACFRSEHVSTKSESFCWWKSVWLKRDALNEQRVVRLVELLFARNGVANSLRSCSTWKYGVVAPLQLLYSFRTFGYGLLNLSLSKVWVSKYPIAAVVSIVKFDWLVFRCVMGFIFQVWAAVVPKGKVDQNLVGALVRLLLQYVFARSSICCCAALDGSVTIVSKINVECMSLEASQRSSEEKWDVRQWIFWMEVFSEILKILKDFIASKVSGFNQAAETNMYHKRCGWHGHREYSASRCLLSVIMTLLTNTRSWQQWRILQLPMQRN